MLPMDPICINDGPGRVCRHGDSGTAWESKILNSECYCRILQIFCRILLDSADDLVFLGAMDAGSMY